MKKKKEKLEGVEKSKADIEKANALSYFNLYEGRVPQSLEEVAKAYNLAKEAGLSIEDLVSLDSGGKYLALTDRLPEIDK